MTDNNQGRVLSEEEIAAMVRKVEAMERVAEIARHLYSHHYVDYNDENTWQQLWDALEVTERA